MTEMNQHIITWQDRTGCGDVSATHIGSTVLLMGWLGGCLAGSWRFAVHPPA